MQPRSAIRSIISHPAEAYCLCTLVLLCVNPGWAHYGLQRANLLLAGWMCLSPLLLFDRRTHVWMPRIDIPLIVVAASATLLPMAFHPTTLRWITQLMTCACCFTFMMYARMLRVSHFGVRALLRLIRAIVYAYAVMLVIQQIFTLTGWGVPGEGLVHTKWKLNSLAAEASHMVITMSMCIWFYGLILRKRKPGRRFSEEVRRNPFFWLCYLWTMLSVPAASTFIFLPISFLPWVTKRTYAKAIGITSCVIIVLFLTTPIARNAQFMRAQRTVFATLTLNVESIEENESSGASRIAPSLRGIRKAAEVNINTLIGHGVDAESRDFPYECDWAERGYEGSAGIMNFLYNYGVAGALALWTLIAMVSIIRGEWRSWVTFGITLLFSAEFNHQFLWMMLAFSLVLKCRVCHDKMLLQK